MEKLRFKTSLKCGGCVKTVTPGLESLKGIETWKVDLESPDKIIEIEASTDISDQVIESVKKAGFQISRL
jgi:copper chaperone